MRAAATALAGLLLSDATHAPEHATPAHTLMQMQAHQPNDAAVVALAHEVAAPAADALPDATRRIIRDSDWNNNWGTDLVHALGGDGGRQLWNAIATGGAEQQSGPSAPGSAANRLWASITRDIELLTGGAYTPVTVAAHACDLLPHVATCVFAQHMSAADKARFRFSVVTAPKPIGVASFAFSYFSMGFVAQSASMRAGVFLPLEVMSDDPSFGIGSVFTRLSRTDQEAIKRAEGKVLQQLATLFKQGVRGTATQIVVLEPLMIPGRGRQFRDVFLRAVQDACTANRVALVADETLSFVRCGRPLFTTTVAGFHPDWVLIGKGLGCAMLLARNTDATRDARDIMVDAFSVVAPATTLVQAAAVLRVMRVDDIAAHCAANGAAILAAFNAIPGVEARGIGHCIWLDKGMALLPLLGAVNQRLLPRVDQTADTVRRVFEQQRAHMQQLQPLARFRLPLCAACGDKQRPPAVNTAASADAAAIWRCDTCIRLWHGKCRNRTTPTKCVAVCGGTLSLEGAAATAAAAPAAASAATSSSSSDDDVQMIEAEEEWFDEAVQSTVLELRPTWGESVAKEKAMALVKQRIKDTMRLLNQHMHALQHQADAGTLPVRRSIAKLATRVNQLQRHIGAIVGMGIEQHYTK